MPNPTSLKRMLTGAFLQGIAWSLGASLGFTLVSYLIITSLRIAGGLPVIGVLIANIVEATEIALRGR